MSKILLTTDEDLNIIIAKIIKDVVSKLHQPKPKEFLSYEEAAELLDIKKGTLTRQVNDGLYKKYVSKSGKPYVSRKEILESFQ